MYNTQDDNKNKQQATNTQPVAQGTQTNATQQGSTQTNAQTPATQSNAQGSTQTIVQGMTPQQQAEYDKSINELNAYANANLDTSQDVDYKSEREQLRDGSYRQRKSATQGMLEMLNKRQGELQDGGIKSVQEVQDMSTADRQAYLASLTDKQREAYNKDVRKQRANIILNALGDGINAISNIYNASKGRTPRWDPNNTLTGAWLKRYDEQAKAREAKKEQYYNYEAQKQKLINEDAAWERQLKKDEDALNIKEREQNRKNALARIQLMRNMAAASKDEALTEYYDEMKANLAAGMSLKQAESQARINYYNARAKHVGSSGSGSSGGRGGKGSNSGKDYTETTEKTYDTEVLPDGSAKVVNTSTTKRRTYNGKNGSNNSGYASKLHLRRKK